MGRRAVATFAHYGNARAFNTGARAYAVKLRWLFLL